MPNRVLLATVANQAMADLVLSRLREAGYPVDGAQPLLPYPDLVSPVEIYLLEPEILDEPGAREEIEELLNPPLEEGLTEVDAAAIEAMPREVEPPLPRTWFAKPGCIGLILALVGFVVYVYLAGGESQPDYRFLKNAIPELVHADKRDYMKRMGLHGDSFRVNAPYKEVVASVMVELEGRPFRMNSEEVRTIFWIEKDTRWGTEEMEAIEVTVGYKWSIENAKYLPDPSTYATIDWTYSPTLAQRIQGFLGF